MSAQPAGLAARDRHDPRVQRTQASLRTAFNQLLLEQGYEAITPSNIAVTAGVGRSTFYEHYAGKAALLSHTVVTVLQPLADAAIGQEVPLLKSVVRHFWDNRRLARRLIAGRTGVIIRNQLAELIEQAFKTNGTFTAIPVPLIAASMAAAQLAMIEVWLTGRYECDIEQLAQALVAEGQRFSTVVALG